MHINNHKDDCMYRYSFNYTPGVGCTCGEGIETTWAEADQTAGSTKKENRGDIATTVWMTSTVTGTGRK
jgi:Kyakuja-Dileera-Zisupton transposase